MPTKLANAGASSQCSSITRTFTGEVKTRLSYDAAVVSIETVLHGIRSFWHLLQRNETVSPLEFAHRIERHYSATNPQVDAVCTSLRRCR